MSNTEMQKERSAPQTRNDGADNQFEWSPEFWKGWRGADDPYRQRKSQRDRELTVELLGLRNGDRVLEVGCGYGWISRALLQAARVDWTGVDASLPMVQELRASPGGQFKRALAADAHALPFREAMFDKVLCTGVLMHLADDVQALREIVRVLRPGGKLVVSVNNAWSPFAALVRLHNLRKKNYIQRFRRPGVVASMLRAMGMDDLRVRGDGMVSTVSLSMGKLHFPPRWAFASLTRLDAWAVGHSPRCAYEVWFAATKTAEARRSGLGADKGCT